VQFCPLILCNLNPLVTAAADLPRLAATMRALADTMNVSYRAAIGNRHMAYEGPYWYFHGSALRAAEAAVELHPADASSRVLYGELKWNLAARGQGEYQRDFSEAREARRQLLCGRVLATAAGNTALVARTDSLLRWIEGMFR